MTYKHCSMKCIYHFWLVLCVNLIEVGRVSPDMIEWDMYIGKNVQ